MTECNNVCINVFINACIKVRIHVYTCMYLCMFCFLNVCIIAYMYQGVDPGGRGSWRIRTSPPPHFGGNSKLHKEGETCFALTVD